jgi:hypothetical protein
MADFSFFKNAKQSDNRDFFTFSLSTLLVVAAISASCGTARASDFQTPRAAGIGGAGHAGPMLNDAIYLNPSYASFLPAYSISGNYGFYGGPSQCDDCGPSDPHGHLINASIQDGRSELFQAGVGFTELNDRKVLNVGASRTIVQKLGVGIGGKWEIPNVDAPPLLWDTLVSMTFVPLDFLTLAAVVDNLFEPQSNQAYGMYREYILGSKLNVMGIMLAYFDPHLAPDVADGNTFGHELGLEFPVMGSLFLRAGNFRNANVSAISLRGSGYTVGAGWVAPSSSFDFALQRVISPVLCNVYSFSMTVFF